MLFLYLFVGLVKMTIWLIAFVIFVIAGAFYMGYEGVKEIYRSVKDLR